MWKKNSDFSLNTTLYLSVMCHTRLLLFGPLRWTCVPLKKCTNLKPSTHYICEKAWSLFTIIPVTFHVITCHQWVRTSAFEVQHSLRGPVSPLERTLWNEENKLVSFKSQMLFLLCNPVLPWDQSQSFFLKFIYYYLIFFITNDWVKVSLLVVLLQERNQLYLRCAPRVCDKRCQ